MAFHPSGAIRFGGSAARHAPARFVLVIGKWLDAQGGEYAIKTLSVVALIGLWYLGAAALPASVMPAPHRVAAVLWYEMTGGAIWADVAISLRPAAKSSSG
ncbi:MAG TPA: hypothetical protein VGP48_14750 [Stellaceae bacterium]|jgi:ABC-type nitrate/sulfonate/bicarbonate transport system permease component|nr:hypothetical protein [Stellaceae bacterium]